MQEPIYNNGTVKVAKEGVSAYLAWYHTLSMADAKEISDVCSRLTNEAAKNAGVNLYDIGRLIRQSSAFSAIRRKKIGKSREHRFPKRCFSSSASQKTLNSLSE